MMHELKHSVLEYCVDYSKLKEMIVKMENFPSIFMIFRKCRKTLKSALVLKDFEFRARSICQTYVRNYNGGENCNHKHTHTHTHEQI